MSSEAVTRTIPPHGRAEIVVVSERSGVSTIHGPPDAIVASFRIGSVELPRGPLRTVAPQATPAGWVACYVVENPTDGPIDVTVALLT